MNDHACEEVENTIGSQVIRCGDAAHTLVKPRGQREGPYWMCHAHTRHNIIAKQCDDVTPPTDRKVETVLGYKIYAGDLGQVRHLLSALEHKMVGERSKP